jgi:hypothetical protein
MRTRQSGPRGEDAASMEEEPQLTQVATAATTAAPSDISVTFSQAGILGLQLGSRAGSPCEFEMLHAYLMLWGLKITDLAGCVQADNMGCVWWIQPASQPASQPAHTQPEALLSHCSYWRLSLDPPDPRFTDQVYLYIHLRACVCESVCGRVCVVW